MTIRSFSKTLILFFALLFILQPFFMFSQIPAAEAADPPTPTSGCSIIYNADRTRRQIKCSLSGQELLFSYFASYRWKGFSEFAYNDIRNYWSLQGLAASGEKDYVILTDKENTIITDIGVPASMAEINSLCMSRGYECLYLRAENDKAIEKPFIAVDDGSTDGWAETINGKRNFLRLSEESENSLGSQKPMYDSLGVLVDLVGEYRSFKVGAFDRPDPSPETLKQCSSKHIPPISSNPGGTQALVFSMRDKIIESLKSLSIGSSDTDGEKKRQEAIKIVEEIFGDWENALSNERDKELYEMFYAKKPNATYPDVPIDENTMMDFRDLVTAVGSHPEIGFDARDSLGLLGNAFDNAGYTPVALGAAAAAPFLGAITRGLPIGDWITRLQNKGELKDLLKEEIEVIVAYKYIKMNLLYNQCALGVGDTDFAIFDQKYLDQIESLLKSTINIADPYAGTKDKTVCDDVKGNWIMAMLGQAFCGMAMIFKQWADQAYNFALRIMNESLGLDTDIKDTSTPASVFSPSGGASTSGGGGSGGATAGTPFDTSKIAEYTEVDSGAPEATKEKSGQSAECEAYAKDKLGIDSSTFKLYSKEEIETMIRTEVSAQWNKLGEAEKHGASESDAQNAILAYACTEDSAMAFFEQSGSRLVPRHHRCTVQLLSVTADKWDCIGTLDAVCSAGATSSNKCNNRKAIALNWDIKYEIYVAVWEHIDTFKATSGTGQGRWKKTLIAVANDSRKTFEPFQHCWDIYFK